MKPLKRGMFLLLMKLTIALGSLWILSLLTRSNPGLNPSSVLGNSWLEYTDADDSPEKVCNCSAILQGEREALEQAKLLTITKDFHKSVHIPDEHYVNATEDCSAFKLRRKYLTSPLSQEEEDFPLAYSMVVHHKVQSFERLLRAIYAPQNIYCVHVDKKAKSSVLFAIMAITDCFPNIFLVSQPVDVVYAAWSRVQADLNCMADLYNSSTQWKYVINLCGQDFPLKTNLEIVRTLRSLRGGNSLESEEIPAGNLWRVKNAYEVIDGTNQDTGKGNEPPPINITIMSGSAYFVVSRGFIRSVLEDRRVLALREWLKHTYIPDELFWATIQRMPGVHGSTRPHRIYDMSDVNAIARLVKWQLYEGSQDSPDARYPECHGSHVRGVCIYGAGDLHWMLKQHHLFANKFDIDTDPVPVYCLEKYLRKRALSGL
ncbi:beta-1,3-galactosyl-O-glycosyl-glycoprotein beta-1,6-N-acetylglucosaminyltransferase isoform X1 [Pleuronectes platessa]|uniref:beta-1,3-galactosyl-O-glycosyl-glycoprotein beta-1,6-N-acetylglucosaminyltransferase isoform X1 n=2 Tax=Pleuronectes platessa TaxID=8262 RepID=UPI00232A55BF|nr:beta-1,3-galactosyl-O-glycosyl-glycoprotein beta-1,6-N-acetylglucosaminyltransferase isoform X1 [Pleuronectes platessa]XP_053277811.1 beta-1,3-galactosyl-O-glycosyl-glycoprotein beta-1,6-N-acetylglucosaminyltransferase isoform X1 [Pleuronectes platessa]